jgi:hypothetical protein
MKKQTKPTSSALSGLTPKSNVRWACRVANRPEQSFRDIRLLDSAHSLIQCADMVTGAVAEYINKDDPQWLDMISSHITVLWHERFEPSR